MQVLDQSVVLDSEIDSLGHMNVRFYLGRVDRSNRKLIDQVGLMSGGGAADGVFLRRFDTYSRFRREQFSGANLEVHGGLLDVTKRGAQCYFEIRNIDKDELAASFITTSKLIDSSSQNEFEFPAQLTGVNEQHGVVLPKHARPRSLSLDPPKSAVSMAELEERISPEPAPGMMSGRREADVQPEDCDAAGRLREEIDLMFVLHRPQPGEDMTKIGPPVMYTDEGHRFSWAMIETRSVTYARPRAGDHLVSIGADIAFGDRWRQSRRWIFVADSGELMGINDTVGLALDLDERRSIDVPKSMREALQETYLPDLAT